jgi:NAD+ kinase
MNIALFGKSVSPDNLKYVQRVIDKLTLKKINLYIFKPFFEAVKASVDFHSDIIFFEGHEEIEGKINFLFSVGGDGTILDAVKLVRDSAIPIMGINLGRLGFLSSIAKDEILPAIDGVLNNEYILDQRSLIKLTNPENLYGEWNYALNDLAITRKDSISLISLHVYIDDLFLSTYWADGLIVATPTGSTAYSLSCGGPILTPGSENFVITPIAPHNLTVRPFVIPDKSKIRIIVEGRDENFFVSLDARTAVIHSDFELIVERADFKVNIVQMKGKDFFGTIREKMKWGLDARN